VVDKVVLGHVFFSEFFGFPCQYHSTTDPYSFMYHLWSDTSYNSTEALFLEHGMQRFQGVCGRKKILKIVRWLALKERN
jgi:hypothetical protein